MQLNKIEKMALDTSDRIRKYFKTKISTPQIYDVIDAENHYAFKIKFVAYNYFSVVFQYELDIIGCSIEVGKESYISILEGHFCYSDCNFDEYFQMLERELRLRIPDKFLSAKGWL